MMAGANLGDLNSSLPCVGPTGLSIKEDDSNTFEVQGCSAGTNNFLAALNCKKGERYALAIQNFDNTAGGFFIDFCGTAMLPCDTLQCIEFTGKEKVKGSREIAIFNDKLVGDSLNVNLFVSALEAIDVHIRNESKDIVFHQLIQPIVNQDLYALPLIVIAPGRYNIEFNIGNRSAIGYFTKLK